MPYVLRVRPSRGGPEDQLLKAAYNRDHNGVLDALAQGADVNCVERQTGLSAVHIAVGNNDEFLCRMLIDEHRAAFFPDRFGRWPTLVAIECGVDESLSEYIAEREASSQLEYTLYEMERNLEEIQKSVKSSMTDNS
jgi:hypothetical protein